MSLTSAELEQFVGQLAADREGWAEMVRFDTDERVYELIWDTPEVNAWLICWSEDQDTGFHDHDQSAAAITVLHGAVREDRLRLAGEPVSRTMEAGSTFTLPPTAIHRVLHSGVGQAVSIHAYSPPLTRMGAYSLGPDGELERQSQSFEEELRSEHHLAGASV
jgi:predicted metal-dependent enzyme (double-stranded beta helix superfamily)